MIAGAGSFLLKKVGLPVAQVVIFVLLIIIFSQFQFLNRFLNEAFGE